MSPRRDVGTWTLWLMVGVLLLGAALVWHDLGQREVLGRDENLTITQLDQPSMVASAQAALLKATGQPSNMQPLYFPIQHLFWPLIQRSAFVLRFLPSILALLAIAFAYKLGQVLFGPEAGVIGALLTALLPFHIRYAQIARPYTLLLLLALASAYFLFLALRTNKSHHWLGFVLAATLMVYTHYNALFVLVAEGLFAGACWLAILVRVLRKEESARRLLGPVVGFLLVGLLCLPALWRLVQLPWVGTRGTVQVELTFAFFHRFLYKIGLTTALLRGLVLGAMALGLVATLYRRRWRSALFTLLWIAVPFLILSVMKSPRPFVERYLIFVPAVALLLAGEGLVAVGRALGELRWPWDAAIVRWGVPVALTLGLALLFVAPVRGYYAANRADERLDLTLRVIESHVQPEDLVIVSPRFFVRPLDANRGKVLYLTDDLTQAEFDDLIARYPRTYVLYSSYLPHPKLQEPMDQWIQERDGAFGRVPIKAISALAYHDGEADDETRLLARVALFEDLAEVSVDKQEAWLRYEQLAVTYETISQFYHDQGQMVEADKFQNKAAEARETAPRPW